MICSQGHESRVYAPEEHLPKFCAVCNQPYDRRIHGPFFCFADGSMPAKEDTVSAGKTENTAVPDEGAASEVSGESAARPVGNPGMRGRVMPVQDGRQTEGFRRGRTESAAPVRPVSERGMHRPAQNTQISGFVLYCAGARIEVPQHGCFLGREEEGAEVFGMNLLISRKHAFVEPVRDGYALLLRVQDAGSLNGTFADDGSGRRQILPGEEILLRPGGRLWLANQILVVKEDKS